MSSILEIFNEKEKKSGVIEALKYLDEYIQAFSEISLDMRQDIIEFGEFFIDHFDEETEDERMKVWGNDDALILQLYDAIVDELDIEDSFFEECEEILTTIDRPLQQEMEKVYEAIIFYPGHKKLSIDYLNDSYHFQCELEENLSREQSFQLKTVLAKAIKYNSLILIDLVDRKIATALLTVDNNAQTVVPRYIKKLHTTSALTGKKLKNKPKGYKYIEANKLTDLIHMENGD